MSAQIDTTKTLQARMELEAITEGLHSQSHDDILQLARTAIEHIDSSLRLDDPHEHLDDAAAVIEEIKTPATNTPAERHADRAGELLQQALD
jgi:hypothetical protein